MPSGKQTKRRRRAAAAAPPPPPPVRSKGRRPRRASPRVLVAIAVVIVLAVAGIVLGLVFTGGSSSANVPRRGTLVNALPGAAEVQRLLKGIPQHGNVLGRSTAPVTMVEYVDLQCPYCQQFETQVMPNLVPRFVRPGTLKVVMRPLAFIGPDSDRGRKAAIAAGAQNRMFNFAQILYVNQGVENTGWLDDNMVTAAAASIPGLDVRRLLDARGSSGAKASAFDAQAEEDSVTATPTLFVGKNAASATQVKLSSPTDQAAVVAAIQKARR